MNSCAMMNEIQDLRLHEIFIEYNLYTFFCLY